MEAASASDAFKIQRFEGFPSSSEDFYQIESKNVPAVFAGCIKEWEAFSKWNPSNGGLDYLLGRVGSSVVEAMLSRSAPVFYGDLRSHERIPLPFSTFITFCKLYLQNTRDSPRVSAESEGSRIEEFDSSEVCLTSADAQQVYLAQVPILNTESKEKSPLEALQDDIHMPAFLVIKPLASINLWMNSAQSRSSTHYDPHHNLLCIISGCKKVVLWPPSASSFLYPMPIYGEASNHSSVDLENPDLSIHTRAKQSMDYSQKIILHAGDALYIPEGWFHQVDSEHLTIAVNFWWQSNIMSSMSEHMDAYYLRRIMRRQGNGQNQMLSMRSFGHKEAGDDAYVRNSDRGAGNCDHDSKDQTCMNDLERSDHKDERILHSLEPLELRTLHELVSLVHDYVNVSGQDNPDQSTSKKDVAEGLESKSKQGIADIRLEDDPVSNILWTLEPPMLRKIFLAMVMTSYDRLHEKYTYREIAAYFMESTFQQNFPRTLEALILHMLTSVGAEVLTQKFDEMDQQTTKEQQSEFYQLFYSVFDDQFAAMEKILNGKESFAAQAFRNVLDQYLGVNINQPL